MAIDGFVVPTSGAEATAADARTPGVSGAHRSALADYARATDHAGTMIGDPDFRWVDRVVLDLHFDACYFQPESGPGRYREQGVAVTGSDAVPRAYVGPYQGEVRALMAEVVTWMASKDLDAHLSVRAAMAHLHLASVLPFRDGNGRVARIVQSLILASPGKVPPEFVSIEEYLGRHVDEYHAALLRVQGGRYRPEGDARPWVRFCVDAQIAQMQRRLRQIEEASRRWTFLEQLADERGWPERMVQALQESLLDGVDRTAYATTVDVTLPTATSDLRRLLDAGLVTQVGGGASPWYVGSEALRRDLAVVLSSIDEDPAFA